VDQIQDFISQRNSSSHTNDQIKQEPPPSPTPSPQATTSIKFPINPVFVILSLLILTVPISAFVYLKIQTGVIPLPRPQNTPPPKPTQFQYWKNITLENMSFKYPPDWNDPEYVSTPFGQSAEIKNSDSSQKITVLSGINKGHSESELSEFLDFRSTAGGEKLNLDGSDAVKNKSTPDSILVVTILVNAKDKESQYSITLQSVESTPSQEVDELVNAILSSFKFID